MAESKVDLQPELQVVDDPEELESQKLAAAETAAVFPSCVVTRDAAQRTRDEKEEAKEPNDFSSKDNSSPCSVDTTISVNDINARKNVEEIPEATVSSLLSRAQLIADQRNDPELCKLAEDAVSTEEASGMATCYYKDSGILGF